MSKLITASELAKMINLISALIEKRAKLGSRNLLTHLRLQKLMWFCCVEYMKKENQQLIKEEFEAWQYGPALDSIYEEYKKYGGKVITSVKTMKELENEFDLIDDLDDQIIDVIFEVCVTKRNDETHLLVVDSSHNKLWRKYFINNREKIPWIEVKEQYGKQ